TEHLHETLEHHAHHAQHGGGHDAAPDPSSKWIPGVALSAAILAVLAAVTALFAGHHESEAMLEQIQASDNYAFYQAKGIKGAVLANKLEMLTAFDKVVDEKDRSKIEQYKKEQEEIKEKADEEVASSEDHLSRHKTLARAVTLFQIAIAMSAISVLVKRRSAWVVSLALGAGGAVFLALGLLSPTIAHPAPTPDAAKHE
ncbi:MAG TPA: DUF4337 family protein, partial [Myxococcota bacterium]